MLRHCVQYVTIVLVIVRFLAPGVFAQEASDPNSAGRPLTIDTIKPGQDSSPSAPPKSSENLIRLIRDNSSWSILSYPPMVEVLREMSVGKTSAAIAMTDISDEVFRLVAKSTNAATAAIIERSNRLMAGMVTYRGQERIY